MAEESAEARTCTKCGSRHLMQNLGLLAHPQGGNLRSYTSRTGFLNMPVPVYAGITAHICADCGHTELVADNLAEMWKAYATENR